MTKSKLPQTAGEMFCHAVYSTWHVINRSYRKHLGQLGLTYPQYITLTLLWERDSQNVSELAAQLAMETSTLTPLLKRLETQGYVVRMRSKEDERQVVVSLTAIGQALKTEAANITHCMIGETGFDQRELEALVKTLSRLRNGFNRT